VGGMMIKGAQHNVVFVATEHNMVYAYDADDPAASMPLWSRMLETPFPVPPEGLGCQDMHNEVGITSTPVISVADNKIYLVSKTSGSQKLHALDLTTGADAPGSPVTIGAAGVKSKYQLNRPGLLLMNGTLYIGFGSHCDKPPGSYHGYILSYDAKTLQQKAMFNVTPSANQGAVWQSGMGLAGDDKGVYFCTGNGSFDGENASMSVLRLDPATLKLGDRYTPPNVAQLNSSDRDLTAGYVFLGDTGLAVSGGKPGQIYLLQKSNMKTTVVPPIDPDGTEIHDFAFWNGSAGPTVYVWPDGGVLAAYKVVGQNLMKAAANNIRPEGYQGGHPGGMFTVSSNGAMAGTGVVWATISIDPASDAWHKTAKGAFHAFDAADVSKAPLFSDEGIGTLAKFSPPMVANGKVYLATFSGKLLVYGLKP